MLGSYLEIAWRQLIRYPATSAIAALMIAVGVAAPSILAAMWGLLNEDPVPSRRGQLYHVQLDHRPLRHDRNSSDSRAAPEDVPQQLTYLDASALAENAPIRARTAYYEFDAVIQATDSALPIPVLAGAVHADFFSMMDVPFETGRPWERSEDDSQYPLVVLSAPISKRLFPGVNPVGQLIWLSGRPFTVVGVLAPWRPTTKFFAVATYDRMNDVYIPFPSAVSLGTVHPTFSPVSAVRCDSDIATTLPELKQSNCAWIQFWVRVDSETEKRALIEHLHAYVMEQKRVGRFPRPMNNTLMSAQEWVQYSQSTFGVRPALVSASAIGLALLLATVANAAALLLSKHGRSLPQTALYRAVGATRMDVLMQALVESTLIGLAAAAIGFAVAWGTLYLLRTQVDSFFRLYGFSLETTMTIDWELAISCTLFGIFVAVIAGAYPAWVASRVRPAELLNVEK